MIHCLQKYFVFFYLALFSASVWLIKFNDSLYSAALSFKIAGLFLVILIFSLIYLLILRARNLKIYRDWKTGAIAVFFACIFTPSYLETDQFRYIWDGLIAAHGTNPFRYAPLEIPSLESHFWARAINHPQYPTIYPPLAQLTFQASTYLNPFFWRHELGWGFGPSVPVTTFFQAEFGLKVMFGLISAFLVFLLRHTRWELLVCHPLFLIHVISNSHVDLLMLPGIVVLATAGRTLWNKNAPNTALFGWIAGILAKWLPLAFGPLVFQRIYYREGFRSVGSSLFFSLVTVSVACLAYAMASGGRFFASLQTYGQNWYFFGYFHRFFADFLGIFQNAADPVQHAKIVSVICIAIGALFLSFLYHKAVFSFRLSLASLSILLLMFFPTLHPWYFLTPLVLGLPYFTSMRVFWFWPLLSLCSHAYYVAMSDPVYLRYAVYASVSLVMWNDFRPFHLKIRAATSELFEDFFKFRLRNLLVPSSLRNYS